MYCRIPTKFFSKVLDQKAEKITINSFPPSSDFCCLRITFANSLDPDQNAASKLESSLFALTTGFSVKHSENRLVHRVVIEEST